MMVLFIETIQGVLFAYRAFITLDLFLDIRFIPGPRKQIINTIL